MPIVDVHEHHLPELFHGTDVGLLQLLKQSYAGWAVARPYTLPGEIRAGDPMLEAPGPGSWEELAAFLEARGANHFVRNMVRGILELHGGGAEQITRGNWEKLDATIRKARANRGWADEVLRQAGIERVITDPYTDPILDARQALGAHYRSVMRMNAFAFGWHPDSRDHNDNSAHGLLARMNLAPASFESYLHGFAQLVTGMPGRGQVAIKNALAYDRALDFDAPERALASQAWGKRNPSPAERKAFGDLVVDQSCVLAAQQGLPVQMHLGTALIRGSHPMNVAPLLERHPGTRFLLMHLAYPWSRDLLGLAFVYRNIWLDLTWSLLLSPSHFKLALHEAIEILPDESRLMLGGDNWHAEETFATMQLARRLIAEVLSEKVDAGYFHLDDALRLARRILFENARVFFQLNQ